MIRYNNQDIVGCRRWNGTAWEDIKNVRKWNGTAWEDVEIWTEIIYTVGMEKEQSKQVWWLTEGFKDNLSIGSFGNVNFNKFWTNEGMLLYAVYNKPDLTLFKAYIGMKYLQIDGYSYLNIEIEDEPDLMFKFLGIQVSLASEINSTMYFEFVKEEFRFESLTQKHIFRIHLLTVREKMFSARVERFKVVLGITPIVLNAKDKEYLKIKRVWLSR